MASQRRGHVGGAEAIEKRNTAARHRNHRIEIAATDGMRANQPFSDTVTFTEQENAMSERQFSGVCLPIFL